MPKTLHMVKTRLALIK